MSEANDRAKDIEFANLDLSQFDSAKVARQRVDEFMPVEYNYRDAGGDFVEGLGIPDPNEHRFPDDIETFYISNSSYAQRAINIRPLNAIDGFFEFKKPSLKLDFNTLPSNPTPNASVINVYGRNEDWVISTEQRIKAFLAQRRAFRPVIHGSGAYDYLIYLVFLPSLIWLLQKKGGSFMQWMDVQPILLNVVVGIYALLLSLLFARFLFQYSRWLFPHMEYYRKSRTGAFLHRTFASALFLAVLGGAAYDLIKSLF